MVQTRQKVFRIVLKCPTMSQVVPKFPLQTHRCPNGLVYLIHRWLPSFPSSPPSSNLPSNYKCFINPSCIIQLNPKKHPGIAYFHQTRQQFLVEMRELFFVQTSESKGRTTFRQRFRVENDVIRRLQSFIVFWFI